MIDDRPRYMISIAAELVGMHPQTLRVYEARGPASSRRTPGNTPLLGSRPRAAMIHGRPASSGSTWPASRPCSASRTSSAACGRAWRAWSARCARRSNASTASTAGRSCSTAIRARHFPNQRRGHGLLEADNQVAGGGRRRTGAGPPLRQPRDHPSTCCSLCSTRSFRTFPSSAPVTASPTCAPAPRPRLREAVRPGHRPAAARLDGLLEPARQGRGGDAQARGRVPLDRAPAPRAGRRPATRSSRRSQVRGSQRVTSHDPEGSYQALEKFGRDLTELAEAASSTR